MTLRNRCRDTRDTRDIHAPGPGPGRAGNNRQPEGKTLPRCYHSQVNLLKILGQTERSR
ncbi:hypothetical protein SBA6_970001 [Candidatus Sulfopaludibacter sp. SbA6]|nr:hypothetical protein SBA6_970001 [Candidatus Sulfopaludibacter sp. SbA6]